MPKLNESETKVLSVLANAEVFGDFGYMHFGDLSRHTGLERDVVRLVCRSLARKGLTQFCIGLCVEGTGAFYGAGYAATKAGQDAENMGAHNDGQS